MLNAGAEEQLVVITVLPTEAPREGAAALKMASLLQSLNHKRVRSAFIPPLPFTMLR